MNKIINTCRIIALTIVVSTLLTSCGDNEFDPCSNCYQEKPTEGIITVITNPSPDFELLEVRIIQGRLENGIEYLRDTLVKQSKDYWVDVGHFYTIEAHYLVNGKHYLVVDGDRVTVFLDNENCDEPCWRPNDGDVDCRLKI